MSGLTAHLERLSERLQQLEVSISRVGCDGHEPLRSCWMLSTRPFGRGAGEVPGRRPLGAQIGFSHNRSLTSFPV